MTKLGDVEFSVGKFGELTPVAKFDPPVQLAGTTVTGRACTTPPGWPRRTSASATRSWSRRRARSSRRWSRREVGPRPARRRSIVWPKTCPKCGGPVEQDESATSYSYRLREHRPCAPPSSASGSMATPAATRMDIDGLGEEVAMQLVDSGLVKSIPDLYRLDQEAAADAR